MAVPELHSTFEGDFGHHVAGRVRHPTFHF